MDGAGDGSAGWASRPDAVLDAVTVPAVSVILPFRNAQRFLPAAIASVQAQDFRDFELLAVDDGSEDGSADLVRAAATADPRVRLIDAGRRGLPGALNEGCRRARGRYLARMDGDDLALPSRLSQQVAVLEHTPDMVVIGGAIDLIDEDDRTVGETWYARTDADIGRCWHTGCRRSAIRPRPFVGRHSTPWAAIGRPASWPRTWTSGSAWPGSGRWRISM